MPRIARQYISEALTRIEAVLVEAAGSDRRLSKNDVQQALSSLAPSEKVAIDAFVAELDLRKKKRGVITVNDVSRAVRGARMRLAPQSGPAEVESEAIIAACRFGAGLVRLSERLSGTPAAVLPPIPHERLAGLEGGALLAALREHCSPHVQLSYSTARDVMYGKIDAKDGRIHDVYTNRDAPVMQRRELERLHRINTEHTRPCSMGVDGTAAHSDLHHIFPTDAEANAKRSSLPFGDVVTVVWERGGAKLGKNADGIMVFEPPDGHKGNVARALFYVAAIYGLSLPDHEEKTLRRWHVIDPVDDAERARNDAISAHQENRNPFVDHPSLIDRIDDL